MRFLQTPIFLILITFFASCNSPIFDDQPHLSDEQLIENFRTHRAEFEKLVTMVLEDKSLTRVDEDWTEPKNFPSARVAEYRRLFKSVGTRRGVVARINRETIEFWASSQGWVAHGSSKGYLYADKCPFDNGKTEVSLDEMSSAKRPEGSGCRRIEGKWHLFFQGD